MLEPPNPRRRDPFTEIFMHRSSCDLMCMACKSVSPGQPNHNVFHSLLHLDELPKFPDSAAEFSKAMHTRVSVAQDFFCPKCPCERCGGEADEGRCAKCNRRNAKTTVYNVERLTAVPEVVVCLFNLYGATRTPRYFPDRLAFPGTAGETLDYILIGQVEHAGSPSGGHYWARCLRAGNEVAMLNDSCASSSRFESPSSGTYLVAYHYAGTSASAQAPTLAQAH
jgi:ubiquitin C-terminal hydrolase